MGSNFSKKVKPGGLKGELNIFYGGWGNTPVKAGEQIKDGWHAAQFREMFSIKRECNRDVMVGTRNSHETAFLVGG